MFYLYNILRWFFWSGLFNFFPFFFSHSVLLFLFHPIYSTNLYFVDNFVFCRDSSLHTLSVVPDLRIGGCGRKSWLQWSCGEKVAPQSPIFVFMQIIFLADSKSHICHHFAFLAIVYFTDTNKFHHVWPLFVCIDVLMFLTHPFASVRSPGHTSIKRKKRKQNVPKIFSSFFGNDIKFIKVEKRLL